MKNNSNARFNIIRKKHNRSKVPTQPVRSPNTTGQKSQHNRSKSTYHSVIYNTYTTYSLTSPLHYRHATSINNNSPSWL